MEIFKCISNDLKNNGINYFLIKRLDIAYKSNQMEKLTQILKNFSNINLEGLDAVKLLKRYDIKYLLHKSMLPVVFDYLSCSHKILECDNKRIFRYQNLYFDNDDYFFYKQHHNKKLNRYKIRYRKYMDTEQCYFEIKFKNNLKKTFKTRLGLNGKNVDLSLSETAKNFAKKNVILKDSENLIENIKPKLWVEFNRLTFADLNNNERLTLDLNLKYSNGRGLDKNINNLVIAEHKSEKISVNSEFGRYLKTNRIFPAKFSKYCVGIALYENDIKRNNFKRKISRLRDFY